MQREVRYEILVKKIRANPDNPRLIFSKEGLTSLEESIKISGILVPLTVYSQREGYIILDGERRFKAATELKLLTVPCYILPPPRDKMEYLLHMFRIHNVREDWKLFPTAKKLEQVIELLRQADPNRKLTNKIIAAYTSLTVSRVSQCRALLTLPKKWQDQLLYEQKLVEKGIQPTKTTLTEDLFFELFKPVKALQSGKAEPIRKIVSQTYSRDQIIDKLVTKFKSGNVPNITDYRLLGRILRTDAVSVSQRAKIMVDVLDKTDYRIDAAYDIYSRLFYETTALERQCEGLARVLRSLKIERVEKEKRKRLLSLMSHLDEILVQKINTLKQVSSDSD